MKRIPLFLFVMAAILACAEDIAIQPDSAFLRSKESSEEGDVFMQVEEQPTFAGGMSAWNSYLKENLSYPAKAKENNIQGAVFVSFIVDETGAVSKAQIIRGIGGGCDEEALRVINDSPNWIPGKIGGQEVKAQMQVRIIFRNQSQPEDQKKSETRTITDNTQHDQEDVFLEVDQQATFPGGMSEWNRFLQEHQTYPQTAKDAEIEGAVFVTFIVDKDGSIIEPQLVRGIGGNCDEEALRVIKKSPKWEPGKVNGNTVKSRMQVRMVFRMD